MEEETIEQKLEYLNTTKSLIRSAIMGKGQEVPVITPFRDYADKISNIETDFTQTEEYQSCLEISEDILE